MSVPIPALVILSTKETREKTPRGKLEIIHGMTACHQINKQSKKTRSCLSSPVWIPSDADSPHVSQFVQTVAFLCGIITDLSGRCLTRLSVPESQGVADVLCQRRILPWGRVPKCCRNLLSALHRFSSALLFRVEGDGEVKQK